MGGQVVTTGGGRRRDRPAELVGLWFLAAVFFAAIADFNQVDPDTWHEMALFREMLALGRMPLEDRFAYTPTVYPSVHHEWGTGGVLYLVATTLGAPGVMALKFALAAGIGLACLACARRRGAGVGMFLAVAPVAVIVGCGGFTTIRAQVFTMLLLAVLLGFLERDVRGDRGWIRAWLPLHVLWVNLHAGFVAGCALLGVHAVEQALRRQPYRHLLVVLAAMGALVLVNPYGWHYYPYLARALRMGRPSIQEWKPIWQGAAPPAVAGFGVSLVLVAYALLRLGARRMRGLLVLLVTAYAGIRHTRHTTLYAVAWLCYMPGFLQETDLGAALAAPWRRRRGGILVLASAAAACATCAVVASRPWELQVPCRPGQAPGWPFLYPVGAVNYLREVGFRGNAMVHYRAGGYVSWRLHPAVKVSMDGRYEVAYRPGLMEENVAFYRAEPGWERILRRYPTDVVLVPRDSALAGVMPVAGSFARVYRDDGYDLYARHGLDLPRIDRSGTELRDRYP